MPLDKPDEYTCDMLKLSSKEFKKIFFLSYMETK